MNLFIFGNNEKLDSRDATGAMLLCKTCKTKSKTTFTAGAKYKQNKTADQ